MIYGTTEESFRKTSQLINRVRHQEEGGTPSRTLKDSTEKEGMELQKHFEEKTQAIFEENGFTSEGQMTELTILEFSPHTVAVKDEELEDFVNDCDIEERLNLGFDGF